MRWKPHVRFGGRAEETDQPEGRHRASARSNHSALTMLAATGATVAELQAHAGHSSPAAALRYQHATQERGRALADLVDRVISEPGPPGATVERLPAP